MTQPLKVCHVSTMTRWGGVERILVDFLTQQQSTSVNHVLLTTSHIAEVMQPIWAANVSTCQPTKRTRFDPGAFIQMAGWLRAQNVNLVHMYNERANIWGSISAQLAGISVLVGGEHGTVRSARPPISWLSRIAYQRANLIIVNSRATLEMVRQIYGISGAKVHVVYNPVPSFPTADRAKYRSLISAEPKEIVVGSIGRLVALKGYKTFLEAAAHVVQLTPNVKFVLVGGGPKCTELKHLANSLGIEDRFIFTGWRQDTRKLLQAFDIFVNTSYSETFGNVLIEAGHAGLPVIAPEIDGVPEAVVNGKTGCLLRPTVPVRLTIGSEQDQLPKRVLIDGKLSPPKSIDSQILAQTIVEFVRNPDLRRQYGQSGREHAQQFSLERYTELLYHLYYSILP